MPCTSLLAHHAVEALDLDGARGKRPPRRELPTHTLAAGFLRRAGARAARLRGPPGRSDLSGQVEALGFTDARPQTGPSSRQPAQGPKMPFRPARAIRHIRCGRYTHYNPHKQLTRIFHGYPERSGSREKPCRRHRAGPRQVLAATPPPFPQGRVPGRWSAPSLATAQGPAAAVSPPVASRWTTARNNSGHG